MVKRYMMWTHRIPKDPVEDEDGNWVTLEDYQSLQATLAWLDEFVTEPEFFPNEGERQFWNEKRKAIRKQFLDI